MTFREWCEKYCKPIVDQYNDGAIELHELVAAIVYQVSSRDVPSVQD